MSSHKQIWYGNEILPSWSFYTKLFWKKVLNLHIKFMAIYFTWIKKKKFFNKHVQCLLWKAKTLICPSFKVLSYLLFTKLCLVWTKSSDYLWYLLLLSGYSWKLSWVWHLTASDGEAPSLKFRECVVSLHYHYSITLRLTDPEWLFLLGFPLWVK